MHDFLPFRLLAPGDPRARLDAPTPEQVDIVSALSAAARRLGDVGVRIMTHPTESVDWLTLACDLEQTAQWCRRQFVVEAAPHAVEPSP